MLVAVTEESSSQGGLLADRLDHLFRTVHPKDPGPYTPAEVAEAINVTAGERVISSTYVWQLRTGRRDNPTRNTFPRWPPSSASPPCTSSSKLKPIAMPSRRN